MDTYSACMGPRQRPIVDPYIAVPSIVIRRLSWNILFLSDLNQESVRDDFSFIKFINVSITN